MTSRPTNITFSSRKSNVSRLGCQHAQFRRVACEATQGKARQPKTGQPKSEKKEAREMEGEGGGALGAFFFSRFQFLIR